MECSSIAIFILVVMLSTGYDPHIDKSIMCGKGSHATCAPNVFRRLSKAQWDDNYYALRACY
jgi:hypothetical protein